MGQEDLILKMNELFRFEKILIFSDKNFFVLLFSFLFVDLEFSFLPLKYVIYFKRRSFCSRIVAKVHAGKKNHFPSFTKIFFPLAEFLHLKYMQRVKVSQIIAL